MAYTGIPFNLCDSLDNRRSLLIDVSEPLFQLFEKLTSLLYKLVCFFNDIHFIIVPSGSLLFVIFGRWYIMRTELFVFFIVAHRFFCLNFLFATRNFLPFRNVVVITNFLSHFLIVALFINEFHSR